jgi:BA14K-like protein
MRKSYLFGTFAILLSAPFAAIGSPVLAQEMGGATGPGPQADYYNQGYYDQGYQPPYYAQGYDQGYRGSYGGRRYYRDNGPVGAAEGVVDGAAETADAVATAPFRAFDNRDSYAMAPQGDSYCAQRYRSYDPASGTFMGYDGQRHPCP